ncbi:MAG: hypothetical protein KDD55_07570 [Bdellovibrionales bacterium]|nr:hypothetical protein [Bdellovibrionales bacterium]
MSDKLTELQIKLYLLNPLCDMRSKPDRALIVSAKDEQKAREKAGISKELSLWSDTLGGRKLLYLLEKNPQPRAAKERIIAEARSKFNDLTTGDVSVFLEPGSDHSHFLEKELPQLLRSPYVRSLNGVGVNLIHSALEYENDKYAAHVKLIQVMRGEASAQILERPHQRPHVQQISLRDAEHLAFEGIMKEQIRKADLEKENLREQMEALNHRMFSHKKQHELRGWLNRFPLISVPHHIKGFQLSREAIRVATKFDKADSRCSSIRKEPIKKVIVDIEQFKSTVLKQHISIEDKEKVQRMGAQELRQRIDEVRKNFTKYTKTIEQKNDLKLGK